MIDLTKAVGVATDALLDREWHFTAVPQGEDGRHHVLLPAEDIARTILAAVAPLIAAAERERIAAAMETTFAANARQAAPALASTAPRPASTTTRSAPASSIAALATSSGCGGIGEGRGNNSREGLGSSGDPSHGRPCRSNGTPITTGRRSRRACRNASRTATGMRAGMCRR